MPLAELYDDGLIHIEAEFRDKELVKSVPGARWDGDGRFWFMPLSWAACVQLRGVFGASLEVGAGLGAWARNEQLTRIQPCLALRMAEDAPELSFLSKLKPFQRAGVQFLATAHYALLADEMGLGKGAQAIAAMEVLGDSAFPALIVCPNSMKYTWQTEFAKWAPNRVVTVVNGTALKRRKQIKTVLDGEAQVLVVNWEGLRGHTRLDTYGSVSLTEEESTPKELNEISWGTVIADEAHKAKDPRAKQTRALWYVGKQAEQRFALTGTPIANSPEDAWSLMRFVYPPEYPGKTKFIERYGLQSWNVFGFKTVTGLRPDTGEELFKILDPRFIRRLKKAVLPQLPPKTYTTRSVEMVPKQKKAYEQMRQTMLAELEGGILIASNPLTKLTRLIQFASALGELQGEDLLLTEPSCKVDALEEIVAELGDQQAIFFAESRQLIEIATARLLKVGYKVGQITGKIPAYERQQNVDGFQSGDLRLLGITLGAGGEGLTLTAASVEIFLQRSWSAVKNAQAEDRAYGRINDAHGITVIDVVTEDSIESRVHEARQEKADRLEEFVRDEATLRTWLAK